MINVFFENRRAGEMFFELRKMIRRFNDEEILPDWVTDNLWDAFSKASNSLLIIRIILETEVQKLKKEE